MRKTTFRDRLQKAYDLSPFESQKALAEAMGVREATVSAWFNKADPSWPQEDAMAKLPGLLKVSGHWLVTGEPPMRLPEGTEPLKLEVLGTVATNGQIDAATLHQILELVRPLSKEDEAEVERLRGRNGPQQKGPP